MVGCGPFKFHRTTARNIYLEEGREKDREFLKEGFRERKREH